MQLLGLHVERQNVTLALVAKDKLRFTVNYLESFSLEDEGEVKALLGHMQLLMIKEKQLFISSPLETNQVLIRTLETPLNNKRAILKTLPFQLENMIPYPPEEVIVAPVLEKQTSSQSIVTLFCIQKKSYEEHLTQLRSYHIDPQWVGCVPEALYRFARHYTEEKNYVLLHMAGRCTHIISVLDDRLCGAFHIEIGKEDFLEALSHDRPSSNRKEREELFNKIAFADTHFLHFTQKMEKFLQELDRIFYFLVHKKESKRTDHIVFTKEEQFLRRYKDSIEQSLGYALQESEFKDPSVVALKPYAIAIGQAMDVLSNDHKTLQFRAAQDTEKTLKTQLLKRLGVCIMTIMSASLMMGVAGEIVLKTKEKRLQNHLATILAQYAQELGETNTHADLLSTLKVAEKKVSKFKKPYGYYLTPTRVSDFLDYVQTVTQPLDTTSLKLEKFHYELVNYPTLKAPLEPYKIKIEWTMTGSSQEALEDFFAHLLQDPQWIAEDPTPSVTKGAKEYAAVFFLTAS